MRTMLPITTDPIVFRNWCRALRIRADIVSVERDGQVVGYEAITSDEDSAFAIALKWTIPINAPQSRS